MSSGPRIGPHRPGPAPGRFFRSLYGGWSVGPRIASIDPSFATIAGGGTLTIHGTGFDAPLVTIDGVSAFGIMLVDAQTLTATIPAHEVDLVDIVVTDSHGRSSTLTRALSYVEPSILNIEPNHGPLVGGTAVRITGVNFEPGMAVTFGGVAASSATFLDSQHYIAITPAHALGPVTVGVDTASYPGFYYTLLTRGADMRRNPSIQINEQLNAPARCTFRIDGTSAPPREKEEIIIDNRDDPTEPLFGGVAQEITQAYEDDGEIDQLYWDVVVSDYTPRLNARYPIGHFADVSATEVVQTLIAKSAPWVDAVTFVQTNLCRVTLDLDGSLNMTQALDAVAAAMGGGYQRLDYKKRLHFGRLTSSLTSKSYKQTALNSIGSGPGTAPTISQSGSSEPTWTYAKGFRAVHVSFEYSDGTESQLGPMSNVVNFDGVHQPQIDNIPIGATIGSLTVVARRVYFSFWGPRNYGSTDLPNATSLAPWFRIADNTTTSYTKSSISSSSFTGTPRQSPAASPAGSAHPPSVGETGKTVNDLVKSWFPNNAPWLQTSSSGYYTFYTTNVYQDRTESRPSPVSGRVLIDGMHALSIQSDPGPSISGVPVVYRKIYGLRVASKDDVAVTDLSKRRATFWALIPNNSSDPAEFAELLAAPAQTNFMPAGVVEPGSVNPFDNCEPGPDPEDATGPSLIDDNNLFLLRDPQIRTTINCFQIRNRIIVYGKGVTVAPPVLVTPQTPTAIVAPTKTAEEVYPTNAVSSLSSAELGPDPLGRGYPMDKEHSDAYMEFALKIAPYWWALPDPKYDRFFSDTISIYGGSPSNGGLNTKGYFTEKFGLTAEYVRAHPYTAMMGGDPATSLVKDDIGVAYPDEPLNSDPFDAPEPTIVRPRYQIDDEDSQRFFGQIEVDADGKPTDGIYEFPLFTDYETEAECLAAGAAELIHAWPTVTVEYATREATHPGHKVPFKLSNPPIAGTFLVQEVNIDQIEEADELVPRYSVSASSVHFELEDLLLMIGSKDNTTQLNVRTGTAGSGLSAGNGGSDLNARRMATSIVGETSEFGVTAIDAAIPTAAFKTLFTAPVIVIPGKAGCIVDIIDCWNVADVSVGWTVRTISLRYIGTPQSALTISAPSSAGTGIRLGKAIFVGQNITSTNDLIGFGIEASATADAATGDFVDGLCHFMILYRYVDVGGI